ncbi:MAG: septum formation initiator family protein [Candidatus Competibacteraceae bacterium]|nr:septum formation initiator family protein [Candidatus Competibacteraceae bacterium]
MQILIAALIAALVMSQYLLWLDEDGVRQTYALRISIQAQTDENAAINEGNRALEADIKDLKTGLVAIEERARSEMGMIRQDETFYRLLEHPKSKSTQPATPSPPRKSSPSNLTQTLIPSAAARSAPTLKSTAPVSAIPADPPRTASSSPSNE